jgi:hypothetical protein
MSSSRVASKNRNGANYCGCEVTGCDWKRVSNPLTVHPLWCVGGYYFTLVSSLMRLLQKNYNNYNQQGLHINIFISFGLGLLMHVKIGLYVKYTQREAHHTCLKT